jgi:hypothetical protein
MERSRAAWAVLLVLCLLAASGCVGRGGRQQARPTQAPSAPPAPAGTTAPAATAAPTPAGSPSPVATAAQPSASPAPGAAAGGELDIAGVEALDAPSLDDSTLDVPDLPDEDLEMPDLDVGSDEGLEVGELE